MDFRRSGQLDERRRRVLMDEIASPTSETDNPESQPATGGSAKGPVRAYSPAVLAERQPRVSDLVPVRPFAAIFLVLLGLTGVAAIENIHIHLQTMPLGSAAEPLAAFDVGQRGSLASYYSALLLALGAAGALAIFGIRSHRVDDYRGRYRIWLWTAAALAWASLDAATGLHNAIGFGLALASSQSLTGDTAVVAIKISWLLLYALTFGTLGVRAAIEVWPSLPSFAALCVGGLLYLVAGMLQLEMFQADSPLVNSVAASTVIMVAHALLASAVGLYARHVHLDAQGRLKVHIDPDRKKGKKAKSKTKLKVVKEDKTNETPDFKPVAKPAAAAASAEPAKPATAPRFGWGSSASSTPPAKASAAISKPAASSSDYDDEEDEEDGDESGQKLSRSERKRLKKLARRDQQQQQQRRAA
jgi:hypothetical protein